MARDAVTITTVALNAETAEPAGTAVTPANGQSIAAGGDTRGLLIRLACTAAGGCTFTFQSGSKPPAETASAGDLAVTMANGDESWVALEGARFVQSDGSIHIDNGGSDTGTVQAFRVAQGG